MDKCPFCRDNIDYHQRFKSKYICGTILYHPPDDEKRGPHRRSNPCYERQILTLSKRINQDTLDINELSLKLTALQAQVAGMEGVVQAVVDLQPRSDRRHWDCPFCHKRTHQEQPGINHAPDCPWTKAQSLLSPTPAREWVSVRREDLKIDVLTVSQMLNDRLIYFSAEDHDSHDRLKAALGTGGEE